MATLEMEMLEGLGIEDIEIEIQQMETSPYVLLARRAEALRAKRKQYLCELKRLEKRGRELVRCGITDAYLDAIEGGGD